MLSSSDNHKSNVLRHIGCTFTSITCRIVSPPRFIIGFVHGLLILGLISLLVVSPPWPRYASWIWTHLSWLQNGLRIDNALQFHLSWMLDSIHEADKLVFIHQFVNFQCQRGNTLWVYRCVSTTWFLNHMFPSCPSTSCFIYSFEVRHSENYVQLRSYKEKLFNSLCVGDHA